MFTLFRPELDDYARRVIDEQRRLYNGGWTRAELRALQLERFADTARYVKANSEFYARHLRDVNLATSGPITEDQLSRIPFTTKDQLRAEMFAVPSQPLDRAWVFYETTGTTGRATPCPRSASDSIVNNAALTLAYEGIFNQHGDRHVVAVLGPSELHSTGDTFGDVLRNLGHTVVKMWPHSPVVGVPRALSLLAELQVTAIVCTPGMSITLLKAARDAGLDVTADFKLRLMLTLGELTSPALLERLGELWGVTVYNCMYASQEASIMATCLQDGSLHTNPLSNYYEIVEPATGRRAFSKNGYVEGELVVTNLYQGAKPLVRYRTGDMVRLFDDADPGQLTQTMQPIGRVRDALRLAGRSVTAFDLEQALFEHVRGAIDYRLTIDTCDGEDVVTVHLEPVDDDARSGIDSPGITDAINRRFGVRCEVVLGQLDAITSTGAMVSWKAARIHDRRLAEPEPERTAALAIASARAGARA